MKSIWEYNEVSENLTKEILVSKACKFCTNDLIVIATNEKNQIIDNWHTPGSGYEGMGGNKKIVRLIKQCSTCGWWNITEETNSLENIDDHGDGYEENIVNIFGAVGCLRKLDLQNLNQPIETIKNYLIAKYDDRFDINPQKFEEVVASVFKDIGFFSRVTNYRGDDGIDIILSDSSQKTIGVQVKRTKNKIEVHQIREFIGALIINDLTEGIYVTTSNYRSGAQKAKVKYLERGYPIKLVDADQFYSALELTQRQKHREPIDFSKFTPELKKIESKFRKFERGVWTDFI